MLFLDIDGVVNNKATFQKGELWPIDKYCAFLVGRIQLETDCKVVLSSAWRHHPDAIEECSKRIVPIFDKTPSLSCTRLRGVEIYDWIEKNVPYQERKEGGSFRYAILDDDSDMLLWQKDHFFQTSFEDGGLTDAIALKVIEHLNS